ncbi:MAG: hypothetical protein IPJ65_42775 [Archangiaceae bacterium]|nr:hypothetical protein [Archangiaceae bacterium]
MDYRLDPVKRMFHDLMEADGEVTVRYHRAADPTDVAEKTMRYQQYRVWLAQAQSNGFVLEQVETTKRPS